MLYFSYGANLDQAAMAARCPRSMPLCLGRLDGYRLAVIHEGWLTVTPDPRAHVHGALWELAIDDVPALDAFEDVAGGLYSKSTLPIFTETGAEEALVYFGANTGPGKVRADYLAAVIAAARAWPLSKEAIAALEAVEL